MDPYSTSPATVLLAELKAGAGTDATGCAVDAHPVSLGVDTELPRLGHPQRDTRNNAVVPLVSPGGNLSDCAESTGAALDGMDGGAWTSMLGMDDDEDVVALLARALHETPQQFHPGQHEQHLFSGARLHQRGAVHHPYHGGVTRGVVSQLRRVQTAGGAIGVHDYSPPPVELVYPQQPFSAGSRDHDVTNRTHNQNPNADDRVSLVDRLRTSLARAGNVRRSLSSPETFMHGNGSGTTDAYVRGNTNQSTGYYDSDDLRTLTDDASRQAEHAARANERALSLRPFGFLGVTRPPWQTRWEAHITAKDDDGNDTSIFLGQFDAKESAARAHDAAQIKLFGEPPACGELNFAYGEYSEVLAEMETCSFEEFVRTMVRHGHSNERRLSRFRGVHAASEGKWEARLESEDASEDA